MCSCLERRWLWKTYLYVIHNTLLTSPPPKKNILVAGAFTSSPTKNLGAEQNTRMQHEDDSRTGPMVQRGESHRMHHLCKARQRRGRTRPRRRWPGVTPGVSCLQRSNDGAPLPARLNRPSLLIALQAASALRASLICVGRPRSTADGAPAYRRNVREASPLPCVPLIVRTRHAMVDR